MIWMLKTVKKEFPYRFDAFDPQYDILAKEVPQGDYWELFTDQMLCSCGKTPIIQWLARYRELTGADYCDGFQEWHRSSDRAFALLVERKEIRLWQFFEQHQEDGPSAQSMKLLLGYAMNISSWQGFRFVRRLLQKYTPVQLQKFFGERFFFHELFVRGNRYSSRDYRISKDFPHPRQCTGEHPHGEQRQSGTSEGRRKGSPDRRLHHVSAGWLRYQGGELRLPVFRRREAADRHCPRHFEKCPNPDFR